MAEFPNHPDTPVETSCPPTSLPTIPSPLPGQGLTVAVFTLGCKLNQYESDALASEFRAAGFTVLDSQDGADVFVVNSCTVTDRASRKSRNLGNRVERQLDRARLVVLTGCHSELDRTVHHERTLLVDNRHKHEICRLVMERLAATGEMPAAPWGPSAGDGDPFGFRSPDSGFHTRATVKIQDGCDSFCSYCIIPRVRGPGASRPRADILAEIRLLAGRGFREIVLTGVNMARWREPAAADGGPPVGFTGLIRSILELELPAGQGFRLRLSSLEPDGLGDDFVELFRHPRLCPSLHLCLQSGSPAVLDRMRRSYGLEGYRRLVAGLRAVDPDFCLSTDLITGFPGETEAEFHESLAALDEFGFLHVHVFPFSRRAGTAADSFAGQLPDRVKDARADQVRQGDPERQSRWLARFEGRPRRVLVEGFEIPAEPNGRYSLRGLCDHGLMVETTLTRADLATLAAVLVTDQSPRRPPTPALARALERAPAELRGALGSVWNRFLTLTSPSAY